jgi:SNF2 family DNA or RNA helicase
MNRAQRDQAVRAFMTNDKAQVLLMSLKCGGVGLNLTRANRAFMHTTIRPMLFL